MDVHGVLVTVLMCVCVCVCVCVQARKRRYTQMQHEATKHQKVKKRKTDLPRKERSKHRPKH